MITIQGKGVSNGIGMGPLCFYRRAKAEINRYTAEDPQAEWLRFKGAQSIALEQLNELAEKAQIDASEEAALLFETHQLMAEDPDYEEFIQSRITEDGLNAEAAVSDAGEQFAAMFAAMDDAYMKDRAADVTDVSNRIIRILSGVSQNSMEFDEPVLLAADDLTPSETILLDKSKILGILTAFGSASSHTAILARTMGIPAVAGLGDLLDPGFEGRQILVDGSTGTVIIDPTKDVFSVYAAKHEEQLQHRALLQELKGQKNITLDGKVIRICCNISSPNDIDAVIANDGDGIGLFRSEFLYLNRGTFPTEEEQFEAYKSVLTSMEGQSVVIRTCDVGADKQFSCLQLPQEENPALGMRALRISLSQPDFFRTQLRALYRASVYGNLGIMFPMVTSVWEVQEIKRIIDSVKRELDEENLPYSCDVKIGIMIETPAAAIISDKLAKEVDFFSCGTNDLTQYSLACDRQNNNLSHFYDPHHPAVIRLLKMVIDNAHKQGIRVGICGELGADLDMTEILIAIGIDELSVTPSAVLELRNKVRSLDIDAVRSRILEEIGW